MATDGFEPAIEIIQAIIVGVVLSIFFNTFITSLPNSLVTQPIKEVVAFLNTLPWIFAFLAILALLTMIAEMVDA